MPKKLDSLFLMDNTINVMKSLMDDSKRTGKEYGFDLCVSNTNRIIKAKNFYEGERGEVKATEECGKDEVLVGSFHTHPSPFSPRPSIQDLGIGLEHGINCIGTIKDKDITCYVKKDDIPINKQNEILDKIDNYTKKLDNKTLTQTEVNEIYTLEDTLKEQYFHKFKIND